MRSERKKEAARLERLREKRVEEVKNSGKRLSGSVSRSVSISDRLLESGRNAAVRIERLKRVASASRSPPSFRPKLDPASVAIVQRMRPNEAERVEERLLRLGRRIKAVKQAKIQQIMKNPQEPATMETIERLMQYQKIYKDHKWMLTKGQTDERPTFHPGIDPVSEEIMASKGKLDVTRPKLTEKSEQKMQEFPFKPHLNAESLKMAAEKGPALARLLSPPSIHSSSPPNLHPFRPTINKSSAKAGKQQPRWQSLYQLNIERRERQAKARLSAQAQEVQQCSFKPVLSPTEGGKSGKAVVSRLLEWGKDRISKLKRLQVEHEESELEECTFAPMVLCMQKLSAAEWPCDPPDQSSQYWPTTLGSHVPSVKSFTPSHQSFKSFTPRGVSEDRIKLDTRESVQVEEDSVDLEKLLKQLQTEK